MAETLWKGRRQVIDKDHCPQGGQGCPLAPQQAYPPELCTQVRVGKMWTTGPCDTGHVLPADFPGLPAVPAVAPALFQPRSTAAHTAGEYSGLTAPALFQ